LSFFVGGLKYKRQEFNIHDARHNSGLLIFAIIVAFVIPEVFSVGMGNASKLNLSIGISIIMILLYVAALYFKLVTHRGVYQPNNAAQTEEEEEPEWSGKVATIVLFAATIVVAYISENLVHTFHSVAEQFGWSELFIGVIIVGDCRNAAEHASAIIMAFKNKMDIAVEIAVGSTLQIAMFVAPVLVICSIFFPTSMPLVFTLPELVAMVSAVLLMIAISNDGDSNWFEGATLLAAYVIMAIGFFLL
ncbi:calcium/proton exchanger, partial [Micromonospora provocatoris]